MKNSTALLRVKKGYRYTRRELVRFANTSTAAPTPKPMWLPGASLRVTVPHRHLTHFRFLARSLALLGHLAAASGAIFLGSGFFSAKPPFDSVPLEPQNQTKNANP